MRVPYLFPVFILQILDVLNVPSINTAIVLIVALLPFLLEHQFCNFSRIKECRDKTNKQLKSHTNKVKVKTS